MVIRLKTEETSGKKELALVDDEGNILRGLINVRFNHSKNDIFPVVVAEFYLDDEFGIQLG